MVEWQLIGDHYHRYGGAYGGLVQWGTKCSAFTPCGVQSLSALRQAGRNRFLVEATADPSVQNHAGALVSYPFPRRRNLRRMAHEFFRVAVGPWGLLSSAMAIACISRVFGFLGGFGSPLSWQATFVHSTSSYSWQELSFPSSGGSGEGPY